MKDAPDYKQHQAELERLELQQLDYVDLGTAGKRLGNDPAVAHGYVWLFRRK
jgi:hypothetical protein